MAHVSIRTDAGTAERAAPLLTAGRIAEVPEGKLADELVAALRRLDYTVSDLLGEAITVRHRLSETCDGETLVRENDRLDGLVKQCVERTSLIHETALESSLHGFCELDESGVIGFANPKMDELTGGCVGRKLSGLFTEPARLEAALNSGCSQLLRLQLIDGSGVIPVLLEIGRAQGHNADIGFAVLTDMREFVDAERSVYDSAPYGVVRLGPDFTVSYANPRVFELFGRTEEEVLGKGILELIDDEESGKAIVRQIEERKKGKATEYPIRVNDLRTGIRRHVRVSSVPEMDDHGHQLVGILTTLHDDTAAELGEALAKVITLESDPRKMFKKLAREIRQVIDFDQASLSVHTGGLSYSRTLYTEPHKEQLSLWIGVPPELREWARSGRTWDEDLNAFLNRQPDAERLRNEPSIRASLDAGFSSFLSLPIGPEPVGSFSLVSKRHGAFSEAHFALLKEAGVGQFMNAVIAAHKVRDSNEIFALLKAMAGAGDSMTLAGMVVRTLSRLYNWHHISIFKVNEISRCLELLAQKATKRDGIRLAKDYRQPLDEGLLGMAYATQAKVELGDPTQEPELAKHYIPPGSGQAQSELCLPIHVNGRVVWILNCEDRRRNAFKEIGMLEHVIDEIAKTLSRLFERIVLGQMVDKFPDGVAIVRASGTILTANELAFAMFGKIYGVDTLAGEDVRQFLDGDFSNADGSADFKHLTDLEVTVTSAHGYKTPVLLTSFTLPDEYDQYILIFKDANKLRWQGEHERLNAAIVEATAQVRVPLAIAASNVRYLGRKAQGAEVAEAVERICRLLSRVELTYDRLQLAFDPKTLPPPVRQRVDLMDALAEVISYFSPDDVEAIQIERNAADTVIEMDRYRLLFAVETILSYLVRMRPPGDPILVRVRRTPTELAVRFAAASLEVDQAKSSRVVEATRARIALAEKVIRKAVAGAGRYRRTRASGGPQFYTLVFPQHVPTMEAS